MKKNLNGKIATIIGVLLIFLYGIFGFPHGLTGTALKDAITKNIHLGLDLRGGAHLVLQVVVKDAVNAETDNTVQRIQQSLQTARLTVGTVLKPDPNNPQIIKIAGTDAAKSSDVRNELTNRFGTEYDVASGLDNSWTLTMKPSVLADLQSRTVDQSIETIRDRVDKLGVSEPVIPK
jgi:preprotein translocase subunit SecD